MKTAVYLFCALAAVGYLLCLLRVEKPVRSFLRGALGGVAALMAVNVLSSWTAVGIAVNAVTVGCAALLGTPGAILLLLVRLFGTV